MKQLALVLWLSAGVALAQVPVTRWHSDANVRLPAGAFVLPREMCDPLVVGIGQGAREDAVCYYWLEDIGGATYPLLALNLETAGYTLANESPLPGGARGTLSVFFHEAREEFHVVFVMYPRDGGVMMVVLPEGPE